MWHAAFCSPLYLHSKSVGVSCQKIETDAHGGWMQVQRKLIIVVVIATVFMIVEVVGGLMAHRYSHLHWRVSSGLYVTWGSSKYNF